MNIIDLITEPVKSAIAGDSGEVGKLGPTQESVQSASPVSPPAAEPLKFVPIDEAIIPQVESLKEPPISEGDIAGNPPVQEPTSPPIEASASNEPLPPLEEGPKRRGRPPGGKNTPKPPDILGGVADPEKALLGVAGMTFDLTTGTLSSIFSSAWNPRDKAERDFMVTAIANYYRETGMVEIPPKTALILVALAYSLPRITEPTTKQKLTLAFLWAREKVGKIFRRKK